MLDKLLTLLRERRLPWTIQNKLRLRKNRAAFNQRLVVTSPQAGKTIGLTITFRCGFHGDSGGAIAIANLATLLSEYHRVEFVSHPNSNFNPRLGGETVIVEEANLMSDVFVCDIACPHAFMRSVKNAGKRLVITAHGKLHSAHGMDVEHVVQSLALADHIHLVSEAQIESYGLEAGRYSVIANNTTPIQKTRRGRNVGTIGNLDDPNKNAAATVAIGEASEAKSIQLWGTQNHDWGSGRVEAHGWESDKGRIYDSIDVLVFMSKEENCPMAVLESLSAGIPCVLSDIVAHRAFHDCPGVALVDPNDPFSAAQHVNTFLNTADELRDQIHTYWQENFSNETIRALWEQRILRT